MNDIEQRIIFPRLIHDLGEVTGASGTLTPTKASLVMPSLYDGARIRIKFNTTNAGSIALQIGGAARTCYDSAGVNTLRSGDIAAGTVHILEYRASNTRWLVLTPFARLTAAQLATPLTGYALGAEGSIITAESNILQAFGAAQRQIDDIKAQPNGIKSVQSFTGYVTGNGTATINYASINKDNSIAFITTAIAGNAIDKDNSGATVATQTRTRSNFATSRLSGGVGTGTLTISAWGVSGVDTMPTVNGSSFGVYGYNYTVRIFEFS